MSIRPRNTRLTVVLAAGAIFFSCSALAQAHGGHPQLVAAQYAGSAGTFSQADASLNQLHRWRYVAPLVTPSHTAPPANTPDQASLTITPSPSPSPSTSSTPAPAPSTSSSPAPVTTGGIFSYSQLEQLWVSVGGPAWAQRAAASVAECESGGNPQAHNRSGASGLWQILGAPKNWTGSTDWFNPTVNAEAAVAKFTQSGDTWAQWSCQP